MIKWLTSWFGKVEGPTKMVMIWNGKEVCQCNLTDSQYQKLITTALPFGFSIISEMDL